MDRDKQEIARKLKILRHAEATGEVARTCRYFGISRASFYRWLTTYRTGGEATLINGRPIPKNPQSPHQALQQASAWPSYSDGCQSPHL